MMLTRTLQSLTLAALVIGATPLAAFAQAVPKLNVEPTCNIPRDVGATGGDKSVCLKSENEARDQLVQQWSAFPVADRGLCTQTATMGGTASYVELLTCLEMRRDARALPADQLTRIEKR
jgi:hypothetical protein